jgi:hypothetical protein
LVKLQPALGQRPDVLQRFLRLAQDDVQLGLVRVLPLQLPRALELPEGQDDVERVPDDLDGAIEAQLARLRGAIGLPPADGGVVRLVEELGRAVALGGEGGFEGPVAVPAGGEVARRALDQVANVAVAWG